MDEDVNKQEQNVEPEMLTEMAEAIVDTVHPEEIILFGSRAKGGSRPDSDVDLLVVMPDTEEATKYRRRLTGDIYRRLARFPVPKDILLYTRAEVEHWRHVRNHIVHSSLAEGRRLYART